MRILVTGASGFVGKNVVNRLTANGHQVTAVSTTSENGFNRSVYKIIHPGLFGMDMGDIYHNDVIIHMAANNDTLSTDKEAMWKANVSEPIQLLYTALHGACKKFIYASSTAVYGDSPAPYCEVTTPFKPLNVYAETKAYFDRFAMRNAHDNPKMKMIGLRLCNVYGPGEAHKGRRMSMIGQMIVTLRGGGTIKLFKDGEQKRDWVYVSDVVDAVELAMKSEISDIYNIGSGKATTFNEIAFYLMHQLDSGMAQHPLYIDNPYPESYQNHTECKIEKARTQLGYEPKFDIKSGIDEYIRLAT